MSRLARALICLACLAGTPAAAATFVVNSANNDPDYAPGDGVCRTAFAVCSLRAAIQEANLDGAPTTTIRFAAPMTISHVTLPDVTKKAVFVDARDHWQAAWPGGAPGVRIGASPFTVRADYFRVHGIEFFGGTTAAVDLQAMNGAVVGGQEARQRNVFLTQLGVRVQGGTSHAITHNYFGTRNGSDGIVGGRIGVLVYGGTALVESNLIVMQNQAGVALWGSTGSLVQLNTIGVDKLEQRPLANGVGIQIHDSDGNTVRDNFVAGNTSHGIDLKRAEKNTVTSNTIGAANVGAYSRANGGAGINIRISSENKIGDALGGNQISHNGGYGVLLEDADDNELFGNGIGSNGADGVHVHGGRNNEIGGAAAKGNAIHDNAGDGVHLTSETTANLVRGNDVGLNVAWDAGNQGHGVLVDGGAHANRIGGLGQDEGNWVAYNGRSGIFLSGSDTRDNSVEGNVVGAPIHWKWPAPNAHHGIAVYDGAHNNWIGFENRVVSSGWSGIVVKDSDDNAIWFNWVGTNENGVSLGNSAYGVHVVNGAGNWILANEVANNASGVRIDGSRWWGMGLLGNPISGNRIHDNTGAGIELVNNGNFGMTPPAITKAHCSQKIVQGTACAGCLVEIFSDGADEGRHFEGSVVADASGAFTWNGAYHGPKVAATQTLHWLGATSPFSAPFHGGKCK